MIFEEDHGWNWERSQEQLKRDVPEYEEIAPEIPEAKVQRNEQKDDSRDPEQDSPIQGRTTSVQGRIRRAPAWSKDCITGDELSDLEEGQNLMMASMGEDPVTFQQAVENEQ